MTLRDLNINLVKTNAIVLRYDDVNSSLGINTLTEKTFNNYSEFNKWFFTNDVYTKVADAEIGYITIEENGTLIIRI